MTAGQTPGGLSTAEVERRLLAALCSDALDRQTRSGVFERLAAHNFSNPDYEMIFRALAKIRQATPEHIRETLSARLTRLGFPDIDLEPIFALKVPSADEIRMLMQQLVG